MADKNNALATTSNAAENFMVVQQDTTELIEIMRELFGTEGISFRDMERIKLPSAGAEFWSMKDENGESVATKTFKCIILTHRQIRVYWEKSLDESGGVKPPDCFAPDAKKGIGNPGMICADCPHSQFGTAAKGRGQACQLKRMVFFLLPDQVFPAYISLPPTSQGEAKSYLFSLASRLVKPYDVVTEVGLTPAKNDTGTAYSKVTFKRAGMLDGETKAKVRAVAMPLIQAIDAADIRPIATEDENDDGGNADGAPNGRYVEDVEAVEI